MRFFLYKTLEERDTDNRFGRIYDFFMMFTILVSIVPLWTHSDSIVFVVIDKITVAVFILDYLARWIIADLKMKKGPLSFLLYPISPMAIIDLLSILPSLSLLKRGFRLLKMFRLFRTLRVFRVFKVFRYSKSITMLINVFKKQKDSLYVVCGFAVSYIIISALVIFNAEPETFPTMFDAIYWATVSLTTVGYGDIYATSQVGKVITMISAVLGIAVVALPAGIIISGYQEELNKEQ